MFTTQPGLDNTASFLQASFVFTAVLFSQHSVIFTTQPHFQNTVSFSQPSLILPAQSHFHNPASFSKCCLIFTTQPRFHSSLIFTTQPRFHNPASFSQHSLVFTTQLSSHNGSLFLLSCNHGRRTALLVVQWALVLVSRKWHIMKDSQIVCHYYKWAIMVSIMW